MIFSRRSPGAMLALASAIAGLTCARLQGEEPAFPEVCRGFLTTERTRLVSLLGSYAWKHASHVHSLSVSADGKRAVSGGEDGNLVLWEVPSGRELRTIENGASVYACAISPDGRLALTGSGAIVKLWDLETGKLVRSLEGHAPSEGAIAFSIWAVAFSPDGKRALTGSADRTARLWDIETGKELRKISHKDGLTSVAFSQDGKRALTGSWDGAVSVCNLEKGNVTPFASEKGAVRSLAFLPDGKRGIAGGDVRDRETGWVEVFDLETGREASEKLVAPEGHVQSIAVSPDGRRVVVGSAHRGDGELRLQHLGGTSSLRLAGGEEVNAVAFLPDGERLLRASGTTLFLHDLSRHAKRPDEPTGSHRFGVSSLAVSKAGDRVVSAGADVKSWELSTGKETPLAGSRGPVALLGDGRLLSGSSRDPYGVRLADLATGDETLLAGHTGSLSAVAATPDGKRGLSVGWDGTLRVWDLEAKAEQRKVAAHEGVASALAVSPDGKLALTGGGGAHSDSQVKLWEIASGKLVRTLDLDETAGRDGVFSLAFSPDGKRGLVSGLALELWDVESGKCLWSLKRASGAGAAAVFSPDGKIVVEGGESAISLHDAETRKVLDRVDLTTSHDHLRALVFAPDGRSFFAGTARGVVLRFELSKRD